VPARATVNQGLQEFCEGTFSGVTHALGSTSMSMRSGYSGSTQRPPNHPTWARTVAPAGIRRSLNPAAGSARVRRPNFVCQP
jgi:hypothetical protein